MLERPMNYRHPFLMTDGKNTFDPRRSPVKELPRLRTSIHHVFPQNKELDLKGTITIRMWSTKHHQCWNKLFRFQVINFEGKVETKEFNIEQIIKMMATGNPFIMEKVGTEEWKKIFKNRNHLEAAIFLRRILSAITARSKKFHLHIGKIKKHNPYVNRHFVQKRA